MGLTPTHSPDGGGQKEQMPETPIDPNPTTPTSPTSPEPAYSAAGTTQFTPIVSANGARVINDVSKILAAAPHAVAVVVLVCATILAIDRVLVGADVVTLFGLALGVPSIVSATQSLKKSS